MTEFMLMENSCVCSVIKSEILERQLDRQVTVMDRAGTHSQQLVSRATGNQARSRGIRILRCMPADQ